MYLRFVRHNQVSGNTSRGSLYTVHFQPNEKGGYNEHPSLISDAYEMASGADYPLALIYEAEVRRTNGHMRLSFGRGNRRSLLHLLIAMRASGSLRNSLTLSAITKMSASKLPKPSYPKCLTIFPSHGVEADN